MKTKYTLLVDDAGSYAENSLIVLIWTILRHRFHHLCNGEGCVIEVHHSDGLVLPLLVLC